MKIFYLTFGQKNSALRNGFIEVHAEDEADARILVHNVFGTSWSGLYSKEEFEEKGYGELFPDGKLGRTLS